MFMSVVLENSYNQAIQPDILNLNLEDKGINIENTILLNISASDYEALQITTGEKIRIKAKQLIINGDTLDAEEISTRGQSTLQFKRKSLSFRLKSQASFRHGEKARSFKKFSILNLAMDKYYSHNRLAFEMMENAGIFNLFYSYCEIKINGRSEGIFMIIERPEEWALNTEKSPLVIRRGYNHKIDKIKTDNKTDRAETKRYVSYYRQIYSALDKYEGEELYNTLSAWIDIDFYMKWLAFNFFVRNGDYSDEVFFYIDTEINKFRIIPWDYDDIFALTPHEGAAESKKHIGNKLLFSSEDQLDKKIASDPYLYKIYLSRMKEVLENFSPAVLKKIFENVYSELCPYYSVSEVISNSQYDQFKDASDENLKSYLLTIYLGLSASGERYLEACESAINDN